MSPMNIAGLLDGSIAQSLVDACDQAAHLMRIITAAKISKAALAEQFRDRLKIAGAE